MNNVWSPLCNVLNNLGLLNKIKLMDPCLSKITRDELSEQNLTVWLPTDMVASVCQKLSRAAAKALCNEHKKNLTKEPHIREGEKESKNVSGQKNIHGALCQVMFASKEKTKFFQLFGQNTLHWPSPHQHHPPKQRFNLENHANTHQHLCHQRT